MQVVFAHGLTGSTVATLHRSDGVVLELPGYDRKWLVPHDLAHFATERALGMPGGVFGSIAAGGVFANMRVLRGRPRHDAAQRSKRLLDANKRTLTLAEVVAGLVHRAVEEDRTADVCRQVRHAWDAVGDGPFPWADEPVRAAADALDELLVEWESRGTVRAVWPERLTAPAPEPHGVRRGRRGRT